ncbi:hypothetical protein BGW80DRAFT_1257222 [Lactifluus volemus]|nr:hypothetical protein BGW80DRAFT_1257222 [Lactifluus volemus]
MQVGIDRGKIDEPAACPRDVCASVGTMSLVHNRCEFADRQVIRLQETPDAVLDGQTPHTVSLSAYDELVDCAGARESTSSDDQEPVQDFSRHVAAIPFPHCPDLISPPAGSQRGCVHMLGIVPELDIAPTQGVMWWPIVIAAPVIVMF